MSHDRPTAFQVQLPLVQRLLKRMRPSFRAALHGIPEGLAKSHIRLMALRIKDLPYWLGPYLGGKGPP